MTDPNRSPATTILEGAILAFTPVPHQRVRATGRTPPTQERFIRALERWARSGRPPTRSG